MVRSYIPVTPLVACYLRQQCADGMVLSKRNAFGKFLIKSACKNYIRKHNLADAKYSERIEVFIGPKWFRTNGFDWTDDVVVEFNQYVTRVFYHVFYTTIDIYMRMNEDAKFVEVYQEFLEASNLSEEVFSFERAKKSYFRYRKSKIVTNNNTTILPQSVLH